MELLHAAPADIWRQLIPAANWMYVDDIPEDELIFHYRDHIYFVNSDGSVLALPKPACFERMDASECLQLLATSDETIDFDDNGEFDYGFVLKQMGYVVPTRRSREKATYRIEIVNTILPQSMSTQYELKRVSFEFALFHALMRCHELNMRSNWEYEHEVKRIDKVDQRTEKHVRFQV